MIFNNKRMWLQWFKNRDWLHFQAVLFWKHILTPICSCHFLIIGWFDSITQLLREFSLTPAVKCRSLLCLCCVTSHILTTTEERNEEWAMNLTSYHITQLPFPSPSMAFTHTAQNVKTEFISEHWNILYFSNPDVKHLIIITEMNLIRGHWYCSGQIANPMLTSVKELVWINQIESSGGGENAA